jgi:N-glycosylase/DNA lyase
LPLRGAGGEPVDFPRTLESHGLPYLPPGDVDESAWIYTLRVRLGGRVMALRFSSADDVLHVDTERALSPALRREAERIARRVFRLDDDLSPFYAMISDADELAWVKSGAGRLIASPTVFEDTIKTICTTNCTWGGTKRMIGALVELGEGAFPSAGQLAKTRDAWFADVARMGYRGPYVKAIARDVARGSLDLEALLPHHGRSEDDVEAALLELPGIGPYAAAHVMQLLGYHHRFVLDSATRPRFLELTKKKRASDATIRKRFARYGRYAGLAFWLFVSLTGN